MTLTDLRHAAVATFITMVLLMVGAHTLHQFIQRASGPQIAAVFFFSVLLGNLIERVLSRKPAERSNTKEG